MACALPTSVQAQTPAPADGAAASEEQRAATIAPADIPARADSDDKFIQMLQRGNELIAQMEES